MTSTSSTLGTVAPPDDLPGVTRRHRPADLYHERTNFQFIRHSRRWLVVSGTLVTVSLLLLLIRSVNLGIDFEGGTAWQVKMQHGKSAKVAQVRDLLRPLGFNDAKVGILSGQGGQNVRVQAQVVQDPVRTAAKQLAGYGKLHEADVQFQRSGAGGTFTFTVKKGVEPTKDGVTRALRGTKIDSPDVTVDGRNVTIKAAKLPASPVQAVADALAKYANAKPGDVNISTVGPTWGKEVSSKAIKALIVFFLLLAGYLSVRFEWKMAVSAIVAVIHDIIFTVGAYALFQFEVTPATVTAFLTILGFSLYDTVVVFDKVGENQRALTATGRSTYGEMVNRSLNAVLMRSLSTSLVALLPVVSLLVVGAAVLGATALQDFALALAAGLFIGSYSSIFVAAPLLAWWKEKEPQYRALAERRRRVTLAAASAATGVPVVAPEEPILPGEVPILPGEMAGRRPIGVPGPPAVERTIQPRARQQRRKKRR